MITGNCIREDAKITGMTPAVLIFNGILLEFPPYIFLPCIFFAYCTGILRVPEFSMITSTTIRTITAIMITAATTAGAISLLVTNCLNSPVSSCGILETMLIVRTMEIPLPIPFSVIFSPIHIKNALPAVNATITVITFNALYSCKSPCRPKPIAIALDSISANATVT